MPLELLILWYLIGLQGSSISLQKMHFGKGQTEPVGVGVYILGFVFALWGIFNLGTAIFLIDKDGSMKY